MVTLLTQPCMGHTYQERSANRDRLRAMRARLLSQGIEEEDATAQDAGVVAEAAALQRSHNEGRAAAQSELVEERQAFLVEKQGLMVELSSAQEALSATQEALREALEEVNPWDTHITI